MMRSIRSLSSSGEDIAFSWQEHGFDSRKGRHAGVFFLRMEYYSFLSEFVDFLSKGFHCDPYTRIMALYVHL